MAWKWTRQRERAAALVAEDRLTNEQIAEQIGIARYSLDRWKTEPEFAARVAELVKATREAVKAEGIADAIERIKAYNDRWRRMQQVIEARAEDPAMANVAGGKTGLLVHTYKMAGGREPIVMDEYAVDTGLLAEMRATEKQAAQELGQWAERQELSGRNGGPIEVKGEQRHEFDYDGFARAFDSLIGAGVGGDADPADGPGESLDTAHPDA